MQNEFSPREDDDKTWTTRLAGALETLGCVGGPQPHGGWPCEWPGLSRRQLSMLELRRRVGRGEARCIISIEIHRLLPVRFSIRGHRSYQVCACGHVRCDPWALPTAQSTRRHADTEFGADAEPPNTHKQKQVSKVCTNAATSDRMNRHLGMSDYFFGLPCTAHSLNIASVCSCSGAFITRCFTSGENGPE